MRASEYPVSLQDQDTRIDIVLRSKISSEPELYALVECKRADPSYVSWIFGASGLPSENACSTLGIVCRETRSTGLPSINPLLEPLSFKMTLDNAKSWLEATKKSGGRISTPPNKEKPSGRTSTPQNIENAFGQALRGIGGFAQEQCDQRRKNHIPFETYFIPIVITTASLYVAEYELTDIDLSDGKISKDKVFFGPKGQPIEKKWVLVEYSAGENIAPKSIPEYYHSVDPAELQKYKIRSIFVVNSKSLVSFFSKLHLNQNR
ncbi:MAG: hypothetical protein SVO26_06645 [Chloroflexota bacterium]|nr:hypothetical protein [Chloroflexota bacterium]